MDGITWRKSTYSSAYNGCVEVADLPAGLIGVRDSKDPGGGYLSFPRAEWAAFLRTLREVRDQSS